MSLGALEGLPSCEGILHRSVELALGCVGLCDSGAVSVTALSNLSKTGYFFSLDIEMLSTMQIAVTICKLLVIYML